MQNKSIRKIMSAPPGGRINKAPFRKREDRNYCIFHFLLFVLSIDNM